jgi:outer membrane lipoprotein-sorting protein
MNKPFLLAVTLVLSCISIAAESETTPSAIPSVDEIVNKANLVAYYQGVDGKSKVNMTITDKQGRTRTRDFTILRKTVQSGGDQKYFVYFLGPADVRKMVFMVHKHTAQGTDDDRWLYLPNLDLVKRIAAGDKRTSFVGSDFLYEDVSGRNLAEDKHELIKTDEQYFVVKNTPLKPETVEFSYYLVSIDRKNYMPMKMEFYDKNDKLYRTIETKKVDDIAAKEGDKEVKYPTATEAVVKDLNTGSTTEMKFSEIQYNLNLEDVFTERYLRRPPKEAMR